MLKAEALAVGYDSRIVLHDIAFAVQKGEILTIIGPNGAGKSTILKSLAGQLRPLAGVICLDSRSMSELKETEIARQLSMMFTDRIEPEIMTCEELVSTGRYPYTGRMGILSEEDHQVVAEAMKLLHVEELADWDCRKISDGQRQRVMLARAVCQEPDILLLDEPTSFLDIRYKLELLTLIRKLAREKGIAVIMSLHELELAQAVSDRILCVKDQRADRLGTPDEIFRDHYIAKLYGMGEGSYDPCFADLLRHL